MTNKQLYLFPDLYKESDKRKPVNVASVPQRSPFRYPGGKTWFVPTFRAWMESLRIEPKTLVEPFAGGGIISLTALFEKFVQRAVMVELDDDVAAVWRTVVDGNAEWLAERILGFEVTKETVVQELSRPVTNVREKAFQTVLKNRTFHGGILAAGAGLVKYGESGRGISSRWYPQTLARRFSDISSIAGKIDFYQGDGLEIIQKHANQKEAVFFIDPPYTAGGKKAGRRLYNHYELNHEHLFSICETIEGDFLMTYDDAEEVKVMARKRGFQMRLIPMTNTHNATMEELVIGKELSWIDSL